MSNESRKISPETLDAHNVGEQIKRLHDYINAQGDFSLYEAAIGLVTLYLYAAHKYQTDRKASDTETELFVQEEFSNILYNAWQSYTATVLHNISKEKLN